MFQYDVQYQDVIRRILNEGKKSVDRTGVGTLSVFDVNLRVDLSRDDDRFSLPALGLRKVFPRTAWYELFWMLRGSLDARELQTLGIKIWDGNSTREFLDSRGLHGVRDGFIGKSGYGKMFRDFNGVDQLAELMHGLDVDPYSRRHYISLWNPAELPDMGLPPCHPVYNFMVEPDEQRDILHLKFSMRSNDWILGSPSNAMFAAFFLTWVADRLGYRVGSLAQSVTNCHIYLNHLKVAEELLDREPVDHTASFKLPESEFLDYNDISCLDDELESMWNDGWDGEIKTSLDYQSHAKIDPSQLFMAV